MEESAPKRRRVSPDPDQEAQASSPSRRARPRPRPSLGRNSPEGRRNASASPPEPDAPEPSNQSASGPRTARDLFGARESRRSTTLDDEQTRPQNQPERTTRQPEPDARSPAAGGPRPSPARPSPRPLPPPAPDGEDEFTAFLRRPQPRPPITGVPIPPPAEPELPPTVSDPVSSTPPRGIHSSPSSRWRGRDKPKKSSPLKPRPDPEEPSTRVADAMQSPSRHSRGGSRPLQDLGLNSSTSLARQVPEPGKQSHKQREKESLLKEIAMLRRELETAATENERIRAAQGPGGRIETPTNAEDVLALVQRTLVASGTAPTPGLANQMAQAALNPMGILPFGPLHLTSDRGTTVVDGSDIRSHHPVAMSAEEELPYLQLFSPFELASQVTVMPPVPNQPLRQRRQVIVRSRDVPGLFTARVDMVVNAMNLNVLSLRVPALEPCARAELGPFLETICTGNCNRTMARNVGILSWAMGEWYRLAIQRARFWTQLERSLAEKDNFRESVARLRREPLAGFVEDPDQDEFDLCGKADLLRFLGQQTYDVAVPSTASDGSESSSVRLQWKVELDWTGEAQSKVALLVGLPGRWREADERGVFGQFPKLFEDLIKGGQRPRLAVRTIVALLSGTGA